MKKTPTHQNPGSLYWKWQRITAIMVLLCSLWLIASFLCQRHFTYTNWVVWIQAPLNASLFFLSMGVGSVHSALGLQVIMEDYLPHRSSCFAYAIWGMRILIIGGPTIATLYFLLQLMGQ